MSAERDLLERNLELLFTRAWRPVEVRAGFRAELRRAFCERVALRGPTRARVSPVRWLVAAAALLLAALGWYAQFSGPAAPERDVTAILAAGEVAWRSAAGPWSSATPQAGAADLGPRAAPLEVRTPSAARARVELASGRLELEAQSHLWIEDGQRARLAAGALAFDASQGSTQSLRAVHGDVQLLEGRARLALVEDHLAVELQAARALVSDVPAARMLSGDRRLRLRAGRIVDPEGSQTSARTQPALEPPALAQPTPVGAAQALPAAVLRGRVRTRDGFDELGEPRWRPLTRFDVVLLRTVALPMAAQPRVTAVDDGEGRFAIAACESGTYSVFVQAPDLAVWRVDDLELGPASSEPGAVPNLDVRMDAGLSVRGVVRDAHSGEPLTGALVVSESDAPVSVLALDRASLDEVGLVRYAVSGPDGGFELEHLARGEQVLRASGAGHSVGWAETFDLRGALPLGGVELELSAAGAIAGRVLDGQGRALVGATVLVSVSDFSLQRPCLSYQAVEVDREGHYVVGGLPSGMLAALLFQPGQHAEGGTPELRIVKVRAPQTTLLDFIEEPSGAGLSGVLRDASGRPLGGRSLWASQDETDAPDANLVSTTTAADGSFAFEGLPAGEHEVFVSGALPPDLSFVGRVDLQLGLTERVEWTAGSESIRGRITSQFSGEPVGAALILLLRASDQRFLGKVLADAQGRFTAELVPPGVYDLCVVAVHGQLGDRTLAGVAVAAGVGVSGLEIELPRGGSLEVSVRDAQGAGLENAHVELIPQDGGKLYLEQLPSTDRAGRFSLEGLRTGLWRVRVSLAGHVTAEDSVEVRAGALATASLVLEARR